MRKFLESIRRYWSLLGETIYTGERLEQNLRIDAWVGRIIALVGGIMTAMNVIQHKGFVTITTFGIFIGGHIIIIAATRFRNRYVAIGTALFISVVIFTYYTVCGVNDGFAILWTILVPLVFCYFASVRYGIMLSFYYEVLFIVLFYTPLRAYMAQYYNETFMNRYPVLYFCGWMLNSIAMTHYHTSTVMQREYEEKLKKAASAAIAADSAKSEFLAQMSHEIRTPINAVLGMNEMILRESNDKNILEYASNIDSAGNTLLALINSILDFSKIEDGKMELVSVEYNTSSMLNDLVVGIEARARAKGLAFKVEVDPSLPSKLYGDDVKIAQVIMNLLTNAVKYTDEGSVTFSVAGGTWKNNRIELHVAVSDTGIGIREEDQGKLLLSFERLDMEHNRHIEGTGLGMSIVTNLLGMMDSSLKVDSVYGEGSTFSFVVMQEVRDATPIGNYDQRLKEQQKERQEEEIFHAPSARVLVVDDNEMNLKVAKGLLNLCDIVPDMVMSGQDAIEQMRHTVYDIVFLDHMMPRMDGIETLTRLKEESLIPKNTAVIALTANAVVGAREAYLAAGFDDYLSKPIEIGELCEKLARYLPKEIHAEPDDDAMEVLEFAPVEEGEFSDMQTEGVFDLERIEALGVDTEEGLVFCAGEVSFYDEVLDVYINAYEEKSESLKRYYGDKNWKDYQILVHALKSTSRTIGAADVADRAMELEIAAGRDDAAFIESHHEDMFAAYTALVDGLREARGT